MALKIMLIQRRNDIVIRQRQQISVGKVILPVARLRRQQLSDCSRCC